MTVYRCSPDGAAPVGAAGNAIRVFLDAEPFAAMQFTRELCGQC
ncbi:hypothetical protein [Mycobacterium heckeshornense]|nr:hypothetical protein [Mycobacterium heckeshornense]